MICNALTKRNLKTIVLSVLFRILFILRFYKGINKTTTDINTCWLNKRKEIMCQIVSVIFTKRICISKIIYSLDTNKKLIRMFTHRCVYIILNL